MTNSVQVSMGSSVKVGQILGYGADSGMTCGSFPARNGGCLGQSGSYPHLHFQVSTACGNNSCSLNPNDWWKKDSSGRIISAKDAARIPDVTMLIAKESGAALDAGGANGTQIYLYPRPDNNSYQRWKLENIGNDQFGNPQYRVKNVQTGKVLDGGGRGTNSRLYLNQQVDWSIAQRWKLQQSGDGYMLINVDSGHVLDGGGGTRTNPQAYMYPSPIPGHAPHIWKFQ
jgi:hypothetical protein